MTLTQHLIVESVSAPDKTRVPRNVNSIDSNMLDALGQENPIHYDLCWFPRLISLMFLLSLIVMTWSLYEYGFGSNWAELNNIYLTIGKIEGVWLVINLGILWVFTIGCLAFVQGDLDPNLHSTILRLDVSIFRSMSRQWRAWIQCIAWNILIVNLAGISAAFMWLLDAGVIRIPADYWTDWKFLPSESCWSLS